MEMKWGSNFTFLQFLGLGMILKVGVYSPYNALHAPHTVQYSHRQHTIGVTLPETGHGTIT